MRMTMRLAYATVNPVTVMKPNSTITQRWPFAAILPVGTTPPVGAAIGVIQSPPYPYVGSFSVEGEAAEAQLENVQETDVAKAQAAAVEERAKEGRPAARRARGSGSD